MSYENKYLSCKKSLLVAYIYWAFGGLFGAHHVYLHRDRHAFVWWSTFGGFIVGWVNDIFRIPRYVREANNDNKHFEETIAVMTKNKKPPFSMNRFSGMLTIGYTWGYLVMLAIPPVEFNLYIPRLALLLLVPLAVAVGVHTVGNIGIERGNLIYPLLGAYAAFPLRYHIYDDSVWVTLMVLCSALAFDSFSKKWRRKPNVRHGLIRRMVVLSMCAALYVSIWTSYLYFHGTITDSEGEEVPIYEALHHFFTSPWWLDVQQCLYDTYLYAQHHGWYEIWKQIIELSDPHGEQNAYKVLGLGLDASQQEITSTWRRLSREHHPDKVKDVTLRRAAQEKFMEIQQAYEILSNSKNRRRRRNKRDNTDEQH